MKLQVFVKRMLAPDMPRLEYVPVDKGGRGANRAGVPAICWALRQARDDAGMTQEELAAAVGLRQPAIQKWETGRRPGLDRLAELEEKMGYDRGYVLRLAGYVTDDGSVRARIQGDPLLTPGHRRIVLRTYDGAVEDSAAERRARSAKSRPAAETTRRS